MICHNLRLRFAEIDIVSCKEGLLHFAEVKAYGDTSLNHPLNALTPAKQHRMRKAAEYFMEIGKKDNYVCDRLHTAGIELKESQECGVSFDLIWVRPSHIDYFPAIF